MLTRTDGIVIVASVPHIPKMPSTVLSAMTTPIAPAFWSFLTLRTNGQVLGATPPPRSTRAILPAISDAFVKALQPSVVDGPTRYEETVATRMCPVVPGFVR